MTKKTIGWVMFFGKLNAITVECNEVKLTETKTKIGDIDSK